MDFTKTISSSTVCNWFYAFFIINAVLAVISALFILTVVFKAGIGRLFSPAFFTYALTLAIGATNSLFFYIICQRSLQPERGA
jgi:hypothetical protein